MGVAVSNPMCEMASNNCSFRANSVNFIWAKIQKKASTARLPLNEKIFLNQHNFFLPNCDKLFYVFCFCVCDDVVSFYRCEKKKQFQWNLLENQSLNH